MKLVLLVILAALGGEPTTADEILEEARSRNNAARVIQDVRMVVVSKNGKERSRELQILARRDEDTFRSMLIFTAPADVAGTKLLLIEPTNGADEQLLYLPAFDRVQRIAGAARKGSFMGSDFTYEDLDLGGRPDDVHTLVETSDEYWVIETTPGEGSHYGKMRTRMSRGDYIARSVEYFDTSGSPLKTLEVREIQEVDGRMVARESVMTTLSKNTSTRLEMKTVRFDVPEEELPVSALSRDALEAR